MAANLAVFDVDGTLTETNEVDSACFVEAMERHHGIRGIDEDWSNFPHTTDRAITHEVFRRAWSRDPAETDILTFRDQFQSVLDERMPQCREIPGAVAFLQRVRQRGWSIVLCTGAWRDSAVLKLSRAGFPSGLLISSSDDFPSREEIVQAGIDAAGGPFERIVTFGDAVWDVRTSRNLGLPFIGVATGAGAEKLRSNGAESIIGDYRDADAVLALMDTARAPS